MLMKQWQAALMNRHFLSAWPLPATPVDRRSASLAMERCRSRPSVKTAWWFCKACEPRAGAERCRANHWDPKPWHTAKFLVMMHNLEWHNSAELTSSMNMCPQVWTRLRLEDAHKLFLWNLETSKLGSKIQDAKRLFLRILGSSKPGPKIQDPRCPKTLLGKSRIQQARIQDAQRLFLGNLGSSKPGSKIQDAQKLFLGNPGSGKARIQDPRSEMPRDSS